MVTARPGEIVLDSKRYKLQDPKRWQRQPLISAARKIGGGDTQYSDYDLWNVKAWTTWHLGRGEEYFETDGRYYDSWNAETRIRGQITLGPHMYVTGTGDALGYESGTFWYQLVGGLSHYGWAESFTTASSGFTADIAEFYLKKIGAGPGNITVSLCSNDAGAGPGGIDIPATPALKSKALAASSIPADNYAWVEFDWTGTQALAGSTKFWLVVSVGTLGDATNCYRVGIDTGAGYSGDSGYTNASDWDPWVDTSSSTDLRFRLQGAEGELSGLAKRFAFFDDNGTEKLFCAAGSQVYAWDATNNKWVDDSAGTGVTAVTFTGSGLDDMTTGGAFTGGTTIVNYKVQIDSTDDPDTFKWSDDGGSTWDAETVEMTGAAQTLNNSMTITFAATTGHTDTENWTFSAGPITDMQVWDTCLVVAQGTLDNIVRKFEGSWGAFDNEREGYRLGVGVCPTGENAGTTVLICTGSTLGTDAHHVVCLSAEDETWRDLKSVANSSTIVGDASADITWIGQYMGSIWICKEDGVYEVGMDGVAYLKFPFFTQKAFTNFWGTCVWHRNELMLPAAYGLWSFDGKSLKNIGPGVGLSFWAGTTITAGPEGEHVGLPDNRQGMILELIPTVNSLYAAVNAGFAHDRYSSVILWTGRGWHEVARGDVPNEEIQALGFTPAGTVETEARLWYGYGKRVFYCILPDTTDDPYQWASSKYENQGWVELGWFSAGLFEVDKDWREVIVEAENVDDGSTLEIFYKLDDDTSYTSLGVIDDGTVGTAVSKNQARLSFGSSTYGKRIRLKVYMATDDPDNTPKVTNIWLKYWRVPDVVWGWNFSLRLTDSDMDRSWRTQEDDLITTYEKKEPVTLVDPRGASHTVRLDKPAIGYSFSETGDVQGALVPIWAYEA